MPESKKDERDKAGESPPSLTEENWDTKVRLDEDEIYAYITLRPPAVGDALLTQQEISRALADKGVTFGILEKAIDDALEGVNRECKGIRDLLVAEGRPVVHGIDASIDYHFRPDKPKNVFVVGDYDRIDYRETNLIDSVASGQLLAVVTPPTDGSDGMTVTGRAIKAREGRDSAPITAGANVLQSSDGLTFTSTIDGHVHLVGTKVEVSPEFLVNGDVDLSTGNIYFLGDVQVQGRVLEDFTVKAEGDVVVKGLVEGARIEAGGDVIIGGGIVGKDKGSVKAEGDVHALFVEGATIEAKGNVVIGRDVLHSTLRAGEKVVAGGKSGMIIGGIVSAVKGIEAVNIGSDVETKTRVEVGVDPAQAERIGQVEETIEEIETALEKIGKTLAKVVVEKLSEDEKVEVAKVVEKDRELKEQLEELKEEKERLENIIRFDLEAPVKASGTVYPGVEIKAGKNSTVVKGLLRNVLVRSDEEAGEIVIKEE